MELNDLKADWQHAGSASKSESELQKMTRITNHPSLRKIRTKLIIETISLFFFLLVYYDWFDGNQKPLYANILLAGSLLLYILNDIVGYIVIAAPVRGANLKTSIGNYLVRLKRLSLLSLAVSLLYSIAIIVFFMSVVALTKEKRLLLVGLLFVLFLLLFLSLKFWNRRINILKQQAEDFDAERPVPI